MAVIRVAVCWLALPGVAGHGTLLESLQSDDFAPYVGYGGPLAVTGRVGPLTSDLWTQTFAYALDGVDPRCAGGPAPGVDDSCGLHVHLGVSCAKKSGRSYYEGSTTVSEDPWRGVRYVAEPTSLGWVAAGTVTVTTGFPHADLEDRPVLVFDYDGDRAACAMLRSMAPLGALDFRRYDGYAGPLEVAGRVAPLVTEHSVVAITLLTYELRGADARCGSGGHAPGGCGVAVHEATHCFGDAGGRVYETDDDPWANVTYAADANGATYGKVTLKTGLRQPAMESRAVVVTDFDGARVACATLGLTPALEAAEFSGRRFVGGSLGPVTTENHKPVQKFAYALENVDPACAGGPDPAAAHSCGLRIHKGESCHDDFGELAHATEDARGRRLTRDPWAGLVYAPGAGGVARANVTLKIGRTQPELEGRVLVIYGRDGAVDACSLLSPILRVVAIGADGMLVYGRVAPKLAQLGLEEEEG